MRDNGWTHVLLFHSFFSAKIRALVTEGGWHRNVGSKHKPPHFSLVSGLLLVTKNTPEGKCHNFFLCVIFNFPFWVMQWSLPWAVFFPWPALGIWDTYKVHCASLFFFLLSFLISPGVQVAPKKKGRPKSSNTSQCHSCVTMGKGILGKQASKSEGSGYSPNLAQGLSVWSVLIRENKLPPKLKLHCCANHSPTTEFWQLNVVKCLNFH